ncbi:hypothetical protein [Streptomyces sp. NPDC059850]|uniref:hypothetical protein n=1 Tax=Streptomyces sp. NPDC059850 TaxID=3346970 RepID=UPI00364D803A
MPYQEHELEDRCEGCGDSLPEPKTRPLRSDPKKDDGRTIRRRAVACSAKCYKRVQRARAGQRKEPKPCRFCGDLVWDYVGNDVRCPEDDRTDHCDELQYMAEARADYVADRREERTVKCLAPGCSRPVTWSGKGRVKTACSPRCRQAIRRARLRGEDI